MSQAKDDSNESSDDATTALDKPIPRSASDSALERAEREFTPVMSSRRRRKPFNNSSNNSSTNSNNGGSYHSYHGNKHNHHHGGHHHRHQQHHHGGWNRPFKHYTRPSKYKVPEGTPVEADAPAKTYYLAIDIETSGPSMVHHFMPCFGAAFIDVEDCKVLEQRIFWIAQPERTAWDSDTVRSFWNTNENREWYHEVLDRQQSKTLPSLEETVNDFVDWVQNHLYAKYAEPHRSHNNVVQLVSDNPSFDLGWLSYYLALGTDGRVPHVQYLLNNRFNGRPIDSRSFCDGVRHKLHGPSFTRSARYAQPRTVTQVLGVGQWKRRLLGAMGVRYDHNPKHDAIVIGMNAAVVACALADRLRTEPDACKTLAEYDEEFKTIPTASSASSSPSSSPRTPPSSTSSSPVAQNIPPSTILLNPASAAYYQHQHQHQHQQQQQQQQQHQQTQQQRTSPQSDPYYQRQQPLPPHLQYLQQQQVIWSPWATAAYNESNTESAAAGSAYVNAYGLPLSYEAVSKDSERLPYRRFPPLTPLTINNKSH